MRGGGSSPARGGDASENDFTLGELIGEGGFGRVYECLMDDGRICAAKVVPILRGRDHRTREAAQKEIEGEVQLMQRLTHPNIVAYFGTKIDEKSLYIFMELVPAGRCV
jgi:serine/threonine protein kinase